MSTEAYDAILFVSFGGPDKSEDVMPFLENVLRGKPVPRERMLEVAEHYYHFGGKSPINDQNRALIAALREELERNGPHLPIYWGNRNWHPLLPDTLRQMQEDGIRHAVAFVTSAFGSYSGCRQYRENIQESCELLGPDAPRIDKLRHYFNHPGFIEATSDHVREALAELPAGARADAELVFTAHSIPVAMAESGPYVGQLEEACRLVAEAVRHPRWRLVYQSRSGPPRQPWLEPDICDYLRQRRENGLRAAVIAPIGFISDHMEVLFDLDCEARDLCQEIGLDMVRAKTVGTHPAFVAAVRDLIVERIESRGERATAGVQPPWPDLCPADCCPRPRRPPMPSSREAT